MKSKIDCIVVGDANVDLIMDGVSSIEFDKEKLATSMDLIIGGSAAITAFNLASLGASVGYVGVLGVDSFGRFIEERFRAAKVDLTNLLRSTKEKTGVSVWHSSNGKRAAITYPGTTEMLRAKDIPETYLRKARHLHIGHYFLLRNLHPGAVSLFRKAKQLGLTTSLDCNYDPTEKWDYHLRDVLKYTDVFFPNEAEALRLTGAADPAAAADQLGRLVATVVVKLGSRGVYVHSHDSRFQVPAKKVRVVDATGAGDSFNAGFLSKYLRGASLRDCARAGIAAGALCVTRVGGTAAFEKKS
jgi:sugar/nucleoside kinase (ribokinase family)